MNKRKIRHYEILRSAQDDRENAAITANTNIAVILSPEGEESHPGFPLHS
jgi:hypothetical protein